MRSPKVSAGTLAPIGLAALLALAGCGSKPHDVDTAEISQAPDAKAAPAPAPGSTPAPEQAPKP